MISVPSRILGGVPYHCPALGPCTSLICNVADLEEKDRKIAALAPPKKKEGFKLSSFTKQISAESEREKKVSQLSPEKVEQLNVKRKDLELVFIERLDNYF